MRQTAKCQSLVGTFVNANGGKTEIHNIVITQGWTDLCQCFNGYDVNGIGDRFTQCGKTTVTSIIVVDRCSLAGTIRIRGIILHICQGKSACIQSRCISCNDLKGGTRLSGRIGSTV